LFIHFKDFLDHARVIFYYTTTSRGRLDHFIVISCSRKIEKNMKGSTLVNLWPHARDAFVTQICHWL
jgi:hypothetical protein